jgi:hypothetical protein
MIWYDQCAPKADQTDGVFTEFGFTADEIGDLRQAKVV